MGVSERDAEGGGGRERVGRGLAQSQGGRGGGEGGRRKELRRDRGAPTRGEPCSMAVAAALSWGGSAGKLEGECLRQGRGG